MSARAPEPRRLGGGSVDCLRCVQPWRASTPPSVPAHGGLLYPILARLAKISSPGLRTGFFGETGNFPEHRLFGGRHRQGKGGPERRTVGHRAAGEAAAPSPMTHHSLNPSSSWARDAVADRKQSLVRTVAIVPPSGSAWKWQCASRNFIQARWASCSCFCRVSESCAITSLYALLRRSSCRFVSALMHSIISTVTPPEASIQAANSLVKPLSSAEAIRARQHSTNPAMKIFWAITMSSSFSVKIGSTDAANGAFTFIGQRQTTKICSKPTGAQAIFFYYDKVKRQTSATVNLSPLAASAAQRGAAAALGLGDRRRANG